MIQSISKIKWSEVMYGLVNGIMVIPVTISFSSIIFRDDAFKSNLPKLVKLVLFSSMIHQLAFSTFSTLPFAVGQVQDAGLIFLSAISGSIAHSVTQEKIVPTTLVVLALCTFFLGIMLIITSQLKLATVVQYIPMPVIGGYLAFIGLFCGEAGISMMAGVQINSVLDIFIKLGFKELTLIVPGLICGTLMYGLVQKYQSPYVLPVFLFAIVIFFYVIVYVGEYSLSDIRQYGYLIKECSSASLKSSFDLYDFQLVEWNQLLNQIGSWIGMVFVVAFSSTLDVAAIEMELGLPLDYNRELGTVGISNSISGLLGGYTGSYIFSQTIFCMRRGIETRLCGFIIAMCELVLLIVPIPIISFVPNFVFGTLLIFIALDLMIEWLIVAREKLMGSEYGICIVTFLIIQLQSIEIGMLFGVVLSMTSFVVSYAHMPSVKAAVWKSSSMVRTFEEQSRLLANKGKIMTISLHGYIFFGSAAKILEDVKSHVVISINDRRTDMNRSTGDSDSTANPLNQSNTSNSSNLKTTEVSRLLEQSYAGGRGSYGCYLAVTPSRLRQLSQSNKSLLTSGSFEDEEQQIGLSMEESTAELTSDRVQLVSTAFNPLQSVYEMSDDLKVLYYKLWTNGCKDQSYSDDMQAFHQQIGSEGTKRVANTFIKPDDVIHASNYTNPMKLYTSLTDRPASLTDLKSSSMLASIWENRKSYDKLTSKGMHAFKDSLLHNEFQGMLMHHASAKASEDVRTEYLVLDFSSVVGLDASATRSCFLMLNQLMRVAHIRVIFASMQPFIEHLLRVHGVIQADDIAINGIDEAIEWCENEVLKIYEETLEVKEKKTASSVAKGRSSSELPGSRTGRTPTSFHTSAAVTRLTAILENYLEVDARSHPAIDRVLNADNLLRFFERKHFVSNEIIFDFNEPSNEVYFVEEGIIEIYSATHFGIGDSAMRRIGEGKEMVGLVGSEAAPIHRIHRVARGAAFGEADYFLGRCHSIRARSVSTVVCWSLDREKYALMEVDCPQLCILVQHTMLKSLSLTSKLNSYGPFAISS